MLQHHLAGNQNGAIPELERELAIDERVDLRAKVRRALRRARGARSRARVRARESAGRISWRTRLRRWSRRALPGSSTHCRPVPRGVGHEIVATERASKARRDNWRRSRSERREAARAGAAHHAHEHRLDLIVARVRRCDLRAALARDTAQKAPALRAPLGLGALGDRRALTDELDVERGGHAAHQRDGLRRVGAGGVIEAGDARDRRLVSDEAAACRSDIESRPPDTASTTRRPRSSRATTLGTDSSILQSNSTGSGGAGTIDSAAYAHSTRTSVETHGPLGVIWVSIGLCAFYVALIWINSLLGLVITPLFTLLLNEPVEHDLREEARATGHLTLSGRKLSY